MKYFIGIDPGKTGAIAIVDPKGICIDIQDLPLNIVEVVNGEPITCLSSRKLADMIYSWVSELGDVEVYLEKVGGRGGNSAQSSFVFGESFGIIKAAISDTGIPIHLVAPKTWKKVLKVTSNKEECRLRAIKLFPEAEHVLNRKKDHNRAEALLIACYGREVYK